MSLYAWGAGNHGQLLNGLEDHSTPTKVEPGEHVQIIVGGGAHTLLVRQIQLLFPTETSVLTPWYLFLIAIRWTAT
jgi:hypothetical protein